MSPFPVRFKDAAGTWQDYDLTLVPGPDGLVTKASDRPVTVLSDPKTGAVRFATAAGNIVESLPSVAGDAKTPSVSGTKATWAGGASDVKIALGRRGFTQDLVVKAASGPSGYDVSFALPPGVIAREMTTGVEFVDGKGKGKVVGGFAGGFAYDASASDPLAAAETPVKNTLADQSPGHATVHVAIDRHG